MSDPENTSTDSARAPKDAAQPEEKPNAKPSDRPHGEKPTQQPPQGASFPQVLLILMVVILTIYMISTFVNQHRVDVPYSAFLDLVGQGPSSEASITIDEGPETAKKQVKYWNMRDLRVDDFVVSGKINREVLAPPKFKSPKPEENIPFQSGRQGFTPDNGALLKALQEKGFPFEAEGYPSTLRYFGPTILLFFVSLIIIFFFFRYLGGSGAMAFSRNRGRLVAQEDIHVTFNDVAGVDEAVEELKETVAFLKTPEKFQALGGRIPRGMLLVGPPGTGKTILAKAVAGEAGVPFYTLSGSDFVELYVGVGAARVRDLFEQAQRRGRAIIFIDELDAIGKIRSGHTSGGSSEEREQTLNALLVEMDGFNTNSTTIVIAATNRPETLDPALLRPGRFDRQVLVDRPDLRGREEILKVHIKDVKLDPAIDLKEIASISVGFVGADLAALVNEAALLAARTGKDMVTMAEFTEGVERITAGLQKKQRVMRPEEKKRVAYHESGHALVAYHTPGADTVHKVSIIPRGLAALGYTLQRPEDDRYLLTQSELEARIMVLLGGTLAEELTFGNFSTGAQNDLERATEIARSMVMDFGMSALGRVNYRENRSTMLADGFFASRNHSEKTAWEIDQAIREILQNLFDRSKALLEEKREDLARLSEALLESEVIETEQLGEILEPEKYPRSDEAEVEADPEAVNKQPEPSVS